MAAGRIPRYRNNSQYSSVADSTYHGLHVSFVQRPTTWASVRVDLHALEIDEQRRRGVLQLADRSDRHHERLGPLRRRPTPPSRDQWNRQHVDGAGHDGVGAHQPWIPGEQLPAGTTRRFRSTSPRGSPNLQGTTSRPLADGATAAAELRRAGGQLDSAQRRNRQRLLQPESPREPRVPDQRQASGLRVWSKRST